MNFKCYTVLLFFWFFNACFLNSNAPTSPTPNSSTNEDGFEVETSESIDRTKANQTIDIKRFDAPLLEVLVHEEINRLRSKKRRTSLQKDACLRKAAVLQNDYVLKRGKLTHNQRDKGRKSVMERTRIYDCTHRMVGENLQFLGFTQVRQNGRLIDIETPTYSEAAKEIALNWKQSPGHYDNLIHKSFYRVGTAAKYDSREKGVYVTQVFGTVPPGE